MSVIHFVREQAYLAGLSSIHESDDCLTHLALVHHPEQGPGRYFLKYYVDGLIPSKGLVNEACGYVLADAAGLPLPDNPLLIELPSERIIGMHPGKAAQIKDGQALVWATEDTGGQPLPRNADRVEESLRNWGALGTLVAFDSWVVIPDRSPANLARRGNREIVAIDHGHLAGSVIWTAGSLPLADDRRHPLLSLLWPGQIPDEINQRIIVASERACGLLDSC